MIHDRAGSAPLGDCLLDSRQVLTRLDLVEHNFNGQNDKSSLGSLLLTVSRSRLKSSVIFLHAFHASLIVSLRSSVPLFSIYIFKLKRDTKKYRARSSEAALRGWKTK
jgi:hypothetical protein